MARDDVQVGEPRELEIRFRVRTTLRVADLARIDWWRRLLRVATPFMPRGVELEVLTVEIAANET